MRCGAECGMKEGNERWKNGHGKEGCVLGRTRSMRNDRNGAIEDRRGETG
jgi:hypothetical protein